MVQKKKFSPKHTLLDEAVILQFHRRLRQFIGFLIGCSACLLAAVFLSYSPTDPSLNSATTFPVQNILSHPGALIADFWLQAVGFAAFLWVVTLLTWGGAYLFEWPLSRFSLRFISFFFSLVACSTFLAIFPNHTSYLITPSWGGAIGTVCLGKLASLFPFLSSVVGIGAFAVFLICWNYSLGMRPSQLKKAIYKLAISFHYIGAFLWRRGAYLKNQKNKNVVVKTAASLHQNFFSQKEEPSSSKSTFVIHTPSEATDKEQPSSSINFSSSPEPLENEEDDSLESVPSFSAPLPNKKPSSKAEVFYFPSETEEYELPSVSFLQRNERKAATIINPEILHESANQLEQVLQEFGVKGEIVEVCPGPVVTLYELKPAPGIKTSRVIGLADDIARSMSAHAARIAVIPGRNVIGIELPNRVRETVYLRELLESDAYTQFSAPLALILGKDIGGSPIIADLARMPHLLVAGTTGSGKSVSINTMILSLLFRLSPDKCKFIMIDPKMLELSVYDGIPHLLSPVVTDPKKAVVALKWAVREMENRYRAMSKLGVRNIDGYNARLAEARLSGELLMRRVQTGFDPDTGKPIFENQSLAVEPLPYIVVVVDEMADLMLVAGKEIEAAVQRLAQMARAAGIHLIMATQRPSVDVITGTIKANFPTRISFQVTSKIDSRTILGEQGAEQLLGQGDMLYMMGGGRLARVHGPFVRDDEVEKIVQFLKMQGEPSYIENITEDEEEGPSMEGDASNEEPLYHQALEVIRREGKVSTSFIQRHLQIGYNRAARIIEQMEKDGIVSPANHVGKREILAK